MPEGGDEMAQGPHLVGMMTGQLSAERIVGLEKLCSTFADDVLGVELTPGLVRIALGEIRTDHRGSTVVRNSLPVAYLVMPSETAMHLAEILATAVEQMNAVTQPGSRMAIVPPKPVGT